MKKQVRSPMTRQEVIDVIERKASHNIPRFMSCDWGNGTYEKYGKALDEIEENYPDDVFSCWYNEPGTTESSNKNPEYMFGYLPDYSNAERHSIGDTVVLLPTWDDFDKFLETFPDPNESGTFDGVKEHIKKCGDMYRLASWWSVFHEKFWLVRGMENLMYDYYDAMPNLKIMGRKFLDYYKVIVDRYAEIGFDGIFTSDDLGHQNGPMMSPEIFEELYLPLYKELIGHVHDRGMHFWLHSCGDNTKLMPYLIEAGVDVLHPIQKGTMDPIEITKKYKGKISFLYGVDVQHDLPELSPEELKEEIRKAIKIFNSNKGGLLLAPGNGIMPDTPLENIYAMLDELSDN